MKRDIAPSLKVRLVSRDLIAESTFRLKLSIDHNSFVFQPGQYLWLKVDKLLYPDSRGDRRALSIASSPNSDNIELIFRGAESGFKQTLIALPINSSLEIIGPFGSFFSPFPSDKQEIVLVAGGVGIAPFLGIIKSCLNDEGYPNIQLVYSESSKKRIISEILEMQRNPELSKFLKIYINIGVLKASFIKKNIHAGKKTIWYFSGPLGIIERLAPLAFLNSNIDHVKFEENYPYLSSSSKLAKDQARNIYKFAADNSLIHTIITDINGRVVYANRAATITTGFSTEEILGSTPRLWGGNMSQPFYENLWKTIKFDRKPFFGKVENRRKNGQHYTAELAVAPIVDALGNLVGFNASEKDISEFAQIDQAKVEFIALASHQLRTPISTINWYTEMLLTGEYGGLNDKQAQYIEEVYRGSRRMAELVDALLNVSRIEMGTFMAELKLINPIEVIKEMIDGEKRNIDIKKHNLSFLVRKKISPILFDPKLLRLVVQTLLDNAIKYTPEGGQIEVAVSFDKKNQKLRIRVSDNGYGIPKIQQNKVFDKFFRADNIREKSTDGTGLGLYLTKSIVEHFRGKIWFKSEEGHGSTFYVTLPINKK